MRWATYWAIISQTRLVTLPWTPKMVLQKEAIRPLEVGRGRQSVDLRPPQRLDRGWRMDHFPTPAPSGPGT
jgi:hypothetical protein